MPLTHSRPSLRGKKGRNLRASREWCEAAKHVVANVFTVATKLLNPLV